MQNNLRSFPDEVRREAGFQLDAAQCGWTQQEAAEKLGIGQSRVSGLVRGKWDEFSLDMLITLTTRAGQHVELVVG